MATITDPQAILFCNEKLRPGLDQFLAGIRTMREAYAFYTANALGQLVAANTTLQNEYIADGAINADGSKGDGRTPILGYDCDNAMNLFNTFNTWLASQAGMETAWTKPTVNSQPLF